MATDNKAPKSPISQERIFLITMIITYVVAAVFLVKNLIGGSSQSALIIGVCMVVFGLIVFALKKANARPALQQMVLAILLVLLVFFISINSGAYYSDDFPLFLALLALTGLYLEPLCTIVQSGCIVVAFILMYLIHPEKAESPSQYFMCVGIFVVAAAVNYLLIRRGRAYIEIANARAAEAERLLDSIKTVGAGLQHSCSDSSQDLAALRAANQRLEQNTHSLMRGSHAIQQESQEVAQACADVQGCVQFTGGNIDFINDRINRMEGIMINGKDPMQAMHAQLKQISDVVQHTTDVFNTLQDQIRSISNLTDQLGTIAFNTKMLALNASVEAARAGEYGAGFSVVANEVQTLAADSDICSNQVTDVVDKIKNQVNVSTEQLSESFQCVEGLRNTLATIDNNYMGMIEHFEAFRQNIEDQTSNFTRMDSLFSTLQSRVADMNTSSDDNRAAAEAIVAAMNAYKAHTNRIMDETRELRDLSVSLLDTSAQ